MVPRFVRRGLVTRAGGIPVARQLLRERMHALVRDSSHAALGSSGLKPVASRDIDAGEVVFQEGGTYLPAASVHTIQVGVERHLDLSGDGRFTAHSFRPSCYCRIVEPAEQPIDIVALRRIRRGEVISFDYSTTEWELTEGGFTDAESGRQCAGFKFLAEHEKLRLLAAGVLPRHILTRWLEDTLGLQVRSPAVVLRSS